MNVELFDYQKRALEKLHSGSILCGGVGSGKSLTGIAYYISSEVDNDLKKKPDLYIITTARKRDTLEWDHECMKFGLTRDDPSISIDDIRVTIDSWNNITKYADVKSAFFIFDEQRVVGYGVWVKSFLKIAKSNHWILLSATPGDTWMDYIPVFIANGFYKNKTEFCRRHVIYNRFVKYPQVSRYCEERHLRRLRDDILVTMDFQRETVPHHEYLQVEYNRELYSTVMRLRWNVFENEPITGASELCQTLRKVVGTDASRFETIVDILKAHPKAIIFYNYDYELEILRKLPTVVAEWNGHKHEPLPTGDNWVYLVQYAAGAEGWNCITTDTIIFYSQNYSYKAMIQAAGRTDRLNTPYHDLYYFHLVTSSKIDLAISRALKDKKNFNESAFVSKRL